MNRPLGVAAAALIVVVLAPVAMAKGPVAATVVAEDGARIHLDPHTWNKGDPFAALFDATHMMSAVFRTDPRILSEEPEGDLGPRFEIHWDLGLRNQGPTHVVRQDAFPFAEGGPVTFVPPGQELYGEGNTTWGGWFEASPALPSVFESLDLVSPEPAAGGAVADLGAPVVPAVLVAAGLVAALAAVLSKRAGPATP